MLASRSRGASSTLLATIGTSVRGGGRGRCRQSSSSIHHPPASNNSAGGRGFSHKCGDIVRRRYLRCNHAAFFGSQSSLQIIGSSRSFSCQSSFLSSPIVQQLRGGDDVVSNTRNNSTSTDNGNSTDNNQSWRRAYLAVGSNLGDRYQNIATALTAIEANSNGTIRLRRTSYLRMTAPMYVTDQPAFLNGAVEIETSLTPLELLRAIKRVESDLGRDVGPESTALRFGPRPVDLDILLFDGYDVTNPDGTAADTLGDNESTPNSLVMLTDQLEIPHPRMSEREFVLSPMSDLEQGGNRGRITHPVLDKTMAELLNSLFRQNNNNSSSSTDEQQAVRVLPLPRGRVLLFNETIIMGILNITPDSFSDGGKYSSSVELAASQARRLVEDGAKIIDVGGESTRPGAEEVAVQEELDRVIPVISRIRQDVSDDVVVSIDTRHSTVARAAVEAGADIVNDVSGGTHDPEMLSCVASMGVPMIIMHMRGNPKTMQSLTNYSESGDSGGGEEVVLVVARELMQRSAAAEAAGIPRWLQVIDPGIGFAKDIDGNLSLLKGADTLRNSCNNLPFLFGPSRKGFIGKIAGESDPEERDYGTIAACLASIQSNGDKNEACNMLRVHNVKAVKQAVLVYEAIRDAKQ
ncbi:hypothetical protein ACHAXR_007633 [Thalassiosira sp. AJA248-18]